MRSPKTIGFRGIFTALALLICPAIAQTTLAQTTATFNNPATVTIPLSGAANPYPSNVAVSGFVAGQTITRVTATLTNINHTFAPDIDILLVSPSGRNVILMSDVGTNTGSTGISNVTLKFDDAAASGIPSASFGSGTYRPTNSTGATADTFPSPAPAAPYGAALSVFNGELPNGTWKLYVVDDSAGDAGNIAGGYSLTITTTAAPTAGTVAIGGRATTANGRGIRNVLITLTDASGNVRTATTTSFGYYRFADVAAGETYVIAATGKRFAFDQPSQVLNVNENVADVNFVGFARWSDEVR